MRHVAFACLTACLFAHVLTAAEPEPRPVSSVVPVPAAKPDPWTELKCDVGAPVVLSGGEAKLVAWRLIDDGPGASLVTVPGAAGLAEGLESLLTNPSEADRIGAAGFAESQRYRWDSVIDRLEALLPTPLIATMFSVDNNSH